VLLPAAPGGLTALEANLSAAALAQWTASASASSNWRVEMPKFTLPMSFQLNAIMQALGATDAFTPGQADFSGIDGAMDLYVQQALHDAWITVDEQGAEAAAATGVGVGVEGVTGGGELAVDHSFDYGIYDTVTGSLLFFGHMVDPSQAPPQ
jgi:serpin B